MFENIYKSYIIFLWKTYGFYDRSCSFPSNKKTGPEFSLMNRFFVSDLSVFVPNLLIFVPEPLFYGFLLSEFLCRWHP